MISHANTNTRSRAVGIACLAALAAVALAPSTATAATPLADKEGPAMVNLKIGPGFGVDASRTTFGVQVDVGYALSHGAGGDFREGDLYVLFSPEIHVGDGPALITLPIGAQYDVPTGVDHLYVYPRLTIGYAFATEEQALGSRDAFAVQPAFGLKYVIDRKVNIGVEPISLPIYLSGDDSSIEYRVWGYAGMSF